MSDIQPPGDDASSNLLVTKLRVPQRLSDEIIRPRLNDRLTQALTDGRFCVIIAPTGWGKTTLIAQVLRTSDLPSTWVRLDPGDGEDRAHFWSYVMAGLRLIHPDLLADVAPMSHVYRARHWMSMLISELATLHDPFVLVLDDFHHIQSDQLQADLRMLCQYPPPALRLILSSRSEPVIKLARLRLTRQVERLTLDDLRFTTAEAGEFLRRTMNWSLDADAVAALAERTNGWPAALQIAALSGRQQADGAAFVARFSGGHHALTHYLDEEVFEPLPESVRDFLLRTSVLDHLSPALCDAVTSRTDSRDLLTWLVQAHLFLQSLDETNAVYRYLPLFSDYLRHRLLRDHATALPDIHRKAAAYFHQIGALDQMIEHLLAMGDVDEVTRLIRSTGRARLLAGELDRLRGWIERLPVERVTHDGEVALCAAWVTLLDGRLAASDGHLARAETIWHDPLPDAIRGEIAVIRAELAHLRGELAGSVEYAQHALAHLPQNDTLLRGLALMNIGLASWLDGDLTTATAVFQQVHCPAASDGEQVLVHLVAGCHLANIQAARGELRTAVRLYEAILNRVENDYPAYLGLAGTMALVGRGWLAYAMNELETAAGHLQRALRTAHPWVYLSSALPGYLLLSGIERARGRERAANQALDEASAYVRTGQLPLMGDLLDAERARLRLRRGDVNGALQWVRRSGLSVDDDVGFAMMGPYLTMCETLIAAGRSDETSTLLARMETQTRSEGWGWHVPEILVVRALAHWKLAERETALERLAQALQHTEREGWLRVFLDRGPLVETMLRHLEAARDPLSFTSDLLRAFEDEGQRVTTIAFDVSARRCVKPDDLTTREREVLGLVACGMSNREIAAALIISEGTVKSHVKGILRKLDCRSRIQAVKRAHEIGLLAE